MKSRHQVKSGFQQVAPRHVTNTQREYGIFKKINTHLGYAFIRPDNGGEDVYVSMGELQQVGISSIEVGARVYFRRFMGSNGKYRGTDLTVEKQQPTREALHTEGEDSRRHPIPDSVDPEKWMEGTIKWFNPTAGYGFVEFSGGLIKDAFLPRQMIEQLGLDPNGRLEKVPVKVKVDKGRKPGTIEVMSIARL